MRRRLANKIVRAMAAGSTRYNDGQIARACVVELRHYSTFGGGEDRDERSGLDPARLAPDQFERVTKPWARSLHGERDFWSTPRGRKILADEAALAGSQL